MKKKVLIYAHYFYPDVASTGQILTELCEGLQDDFQITVICVVPSYTGKIEPEYKKRLLFMEKHHNVNVIRVRVSEFDKSSKLSRAKNILAYFFGAIYATFKVGDQDLIFSISQPPILGGVLGVIGKVIKKSKFIYNIQDFNPEQTEVVGYSKSRILIKVARAIDKLSCKLSDLIIVVGRDMQETLNRRFNYKNVPRNVVINNWIDEKQIFPISSEHPDVIAFKKKYNLMNKFIFMYSGNIGLYYDLENIIKVIGEFKNRNDIVFAFVGDGSVKQKLVDYVEDNKLENVRFIPYQKKEELNFSLNAADVHIVTNAKGIKGISVPSKVYGVMACGKSILSILEEHSEARLLIEGSGCGMSAAPGDYLKIKDIINYIIENKGSFRDLGMKGRLFLEKGYTKDNSIKKYKSFIANT